MAVREPARIREQQTPIRRTDRSYLRNTEAGMSSAQIATTFARIGAQYGVWNNKILPKARETESEYAVRAGRIEAIVSHRATMNIAKKYGFTYTRRKR